MIVHEVKTRFVNSYVVEEVDRLFVVDVALHGEKYLLGHIRDTLGRELSRVELVICTHDDPDHNGGIVAVAHECGAKIGLPYAAHSLARKLWHDPWGLYYRPVTALGEFLRPRMWRMYINPCKSRKLRTNPSLKAHNPSRLADRKLPPDYSLKSNEALPGFDDWVVIHTPGHSWDSCCYFHRPTRSLISGDTLLGSEKCGKLVLPSIYANPWQLARTLVTLKTLDPRHVYPGHGSSFHGEGLLDQL